MAKRPQATCHRLIAPLLVLLAISTAADERRIRVGTSGDYPPFSEADPESSSGYRGFEIALAERYAADRGLEIEWRSFRWSELLEALTAGRFDVAMSGVTLRPERSLAGRFSVPTTESGALALVVDPHAHPNLEALNTPGVRIGVNAGGHLERVATRHFPRATLLAFDENRAVLTALVEGKVHAAVTDTHEAALWARAVPGSARLGPFTRDRKAWLVDADQAELAADLDAWLLAREADGSLEAIRRAQLRHAGPRTAEALRALAAALDERLSLMPWVALAKQRQGMPVNVPEREARVLEAAVTAVAAAARRAGREPPPREAIVGFFRAQFAAAKQVQETTLAQTAARSLEALPDLQTQLRPALLRIGERMARLIVALPAAGIDGRRVRAVVDEEIRIPELEPLSRERLAAALVDLVEAIRAQRLSAKRRTPCAETCPAEFSRPHAAG